MTRHFLTATDISRDELSWLLDTAASLKAGGEPNASRLLAGKTLLLLFHKPSTRTRLSFQVGMFQLGGQTIDLPHQESQIPRGESLEDTARIFSRYVDAVVIRTFGHDSLIQWSRYAAVPIINGLSDRFHPCQLLADIMTIKEKKGATSGLKVAYIGDGNNVCHSWITAACLLDLELVIAAPQGFDPDPSVMAEAAAIGFRGPRPAIVRDPKAAAAGADVIYTDVWTSMGQEAEREKRLMAFHGYQVNEALIESASDDVLVMHCLPAHRGEEISAAAADGPRSVIFDQAENRLHAQKALLLLFLHRIASSR